MDTLSKAVIKLEPETFKTDIAWLETIKDYIQSTELMMQLQMTDDLEYLAQLDQQITQLASYRITA